MEALMRHLLLALFITVFTISFSGCVPPHHEDHYNHTTVNVNRNVHRNTNKNVHRPPAHYNNAHKPPVHHHNPSHNNARYNRHVRHNQ